MTHFADLDYLRQGEIAATFPNLASFVAVHGTGRIETMLIGLLEIETDLFEDVPNFHETTSLDDVRDTIEYYRAFPDWIWEGFGDIRQAIFEQSENWMWRRNRNLKTSQVLTLDSLSAMLKELTDES